MRVTAYFLILMSLGQSLRAQAPELAAYVPTPEQLQAATADRTPPWTGARAYKLRVQPHWSEDGQSFWYANDLPLLVNDLPVGRREFIRVDTTTGTRSPAFDHDRLTEALRTANEPDARNLLLTDLQFVTDGLEFRIGRKAYHCTLPDYTLKPSELTPRKSDLSRRGVPRASRSTGPETFVTFVNKTDGEVELFWLDEGGQRRSYGKLAAGESRQQHTFTGHVWGVFTAEGQPLGRYEADESGGTVEISVQPPEGDAGVAPPARALTAPRRDPLVSPDGRWVASIRDFNLVVKPTDGEERQLTRDGTAERHYQLRSPFWSSDSRHLVAFRVEPATPQQVHFIESSPQGGGRAVLHSHPYPLPGDKFPAYDLRIFDVQERVVFSPEVRIEFGEPQIRWAADGQHFTLQQIDRGHQRFRLLRVDSHTGQSLSLIDEQTTTFLWTAHPEGRGVELVTWLEDSNEFLYATERSGWRHLELHDATTGELKHLITSGEYVVRGIDSIDEANRQIWFRASGMIPGQDPYFIHHYRVNFDGTGLTALTDGNGNHTVQFSPHRSHLIDTYSRVDMAPVHELRRTSDGQLVCSLETADIAEWLTAGWSPPEVIVAKGRDGVTDIWGILYKPRHFDATKRYPVIEDIYAGPHGSFVPKTFSPGRRNPLTDLGFFVVQIDGMGTANRSKAFHDVCWKNLKDAGLPDRILWHQAVAAKYPQYDITRVGIYGTSAGGQESTAAVLFHPEFYKVAVSSCGCHDNRMDKASWNEQWMGYPVGPHYAESSNIDHAHRLQGKLLLIVGEMDTNVPPESTLRLADALIKANKEFDMLVVPGAGHGNGGAYGVRKMRNFFMRHLHGVEP